MTPPLKARLKETPALFHAAKTAQAVLNAAQRAGWRATRGFAIERYLRGPGPHGLALGSGHHPPAGWLATDLDPTVASGVVFLDVTEPFPFPDQAFDRIHSEHLVEHVSLAGGRAMLAECRRVLKRGGRLRIATPDLARLASLVTSLAGPSPEGADYVAWIARTFRDERLEPRAADVLNHGMRAWGHVFLYDEGTLRDELLRAGFAAVTRHAMNESVDPGMRGLKTHAETVGGEPHVAWETMVLEAMNP
jgi:predicted SAM-dependent methyltransferase